MDTNCRHLQDAENLLVNIPLPSLLRRLLPSVWPRPHGPRHHRRGDSRRELRGQVHDDYQRSRLRDIRHCVGPLQQVN